MNLEGDLPVQNTRSNSLKPPIVVAVVLIIAIFAATGGYLLAARQKQSTFPSQMTRVGDERPPDIPSGWEIYTSQEFGYSLAYPGVWRIYTLPSELKTGSYWSDVSVSFNGSRQNELSETLQDGITVTIWLFDNNEGLSLSQWLREYDRDWQSLRTVYKSDEVQKQGIKGILREENCMECGGSVMSYYFPIQKMILLFSLQVSNPDPTTARQYQDVADRVYEHFHLPLPPSPGQG